jgi:protocatechuate 3,4-dioxygenase beta subunit
VRPLYVTSHYVEPSMRDYYTTEVHGRVTTGQEGRWRTRTIHPSTAHFSSQTASFNDVARRVLWSISNSFRDRIHGTNFALCSRVDILARVTAALNTDPEGATAELDRTHEEL